MPFLNVGNDMIQARSGFFDRTNDAVIDKHDCNDGDQNTDQRGCYGCNKGLYIAVVLRLYFGTDRILNVFLHCIQLTLHLIGTGLHEIGHIGLCQLFHHVVTELGGRCVGILIHFKIFTEIIDQL